MITRKQLSRRTLLRGVGASIALPALDAMSPALASLNRVKAKSPVRLAFVYVPNGIILNEWRPAKTGRDFEFTRILKPLEKYRDDLFVLRGLDDRNGNELGDGPGDHARAGASILTGVHPRKTAGADVKGGVSVDQIAAQHFGRETRLPSLELGCEDARTVGNCDSGYSCAYTNSISWRGPTTPMPPEVNPRMAFERLFGVADFSLDEKTRTRRAQQRKSILDLVRDDTQQLAKTLGTNDRRKIDEYLTAVREIEKRIQLAEHLDVNPALEKPSGIPLDFSEYARLMYDLMLVGFQADVTRVATFMVGREGSLRVYPEIGVPDPHHPLTHHRNNADWIEKVTKINCLHVQLFADFLGRLQATPDGDGTLLDHAAIVYTSGLADGNRHTHEDLPVLLAGHGDGALKPGSHLALKSGTPMTNLYLTLLDKAGVRTDKLGDSNGRLEPLSELNGV